VIGGKNFRKILKKFRTRTTPTPKNANKDLYPPLCSPKSAVGQDLDPVAHHAHFVQGGLSVKDDQVIVDHVPLHPPAVLKGYLTSIFTKGQINDLRTLHSKRVKKM
jgi:hypothetical protein